MGLFDKKKQLVINEFKCPVEGCSFTCNDPKLLKKHTDWKHSEFSATAQKVKQEIT